ncbi:MAG: hypothetical protein IJ733_03160 [Lachnospiraceae bacterium]|nr:hypothetical protein [Lachnospiraceae bacterium]
MDFEAELEKFQPSLDIERAEDSIAGKSIMDVTDIIHAILQEPGGKKTEEIGDNTIEWVEGV